MTKSYAMLPLLMLMSFTGILHGARLPFNSSELKLKLPVGCSDPPLGVSYQIKYYSGIVNCGNLLLESDIGGTHPWIPPAITFPMDDAPGSLYTLIYFDPYVNVPKNGSWPDCGTECTGTKAPARHWVVGNIEVAMLKTGNLSAATTVSAFKGPSPPFGSHPYAQFLFKQSGTKKIDFTRLPSPTGIYNWDILGFLSQYRLEDIVAYNWHVTQHTEPRQ
ncbi:hypothetical protein CYMTET_46483 [Cymbomonas tetramitiformis]|uniref:Uncharacterized protein n=1 Tax=Cymbomonas tetramitiformis TaxID=36881 RepID=A0AAE0BXW1_9CHLO|nr:hypothetical protein CYMTET_46483 [Cymbomonas tetramitiformis]